MTAQTAQPENKPKTNETYDAVGDAPQLQSGEMLLVEAYAAFWLVLLVFVGIMFVRTRKMEGQLATLVTALAKARARDDAKRAETKSSARSATADKAAPSGEA